MKCTIPEISWHNRDPVLSIDIQKQNQDEQFYRLASGGTDSHVLIWHVKPSEDGTTTVDFASDLVRHQKAVNVVRFSPCGEFLASGDDESVIIIWKRRQETDAPELGGPGDNEAANKESWTVVKILRGHLEDVYDLCWSPDSSSIISGSVDNTAIMWDVQKGTRTILDDHKGFVQGVAWDPKNEILATLSSDRKLRIFQHASKKLLARVGKALLPVPKDHDLYGKKVNLFHDDTIQTFFRRLTFSPDGELIIAPSGVIEPQEQGKKQTSTTLVFSRRLLNRPVCYLPSLDQYSVCVKCCPVLFELRNIDPSTKPESMFALPYRVIFAVATASAVVLYDTQQPMPFGYVSNLHYTRLTDLAWAPKGDMLMVSSTDGYCSLITFAPGELGVPYEPEEVSVGTNIPSSAPPTPASVVAEKQPDDVDTAISNQSHLVANIDLTKDEDDFEGIKKLDEECSEVKKCDTDKNSKSCSTPEVDEKKNPSSKNTNTFGTLNQPENEDSKSPASHSSNKPVIEEIVTPGNSEKKARRVQLITLSSPKSRKKLL